MQMRKIDLLEIKVYDLICMHRYIRYSDRNSFGDKSMTYTIELDNKTYENILDVKQKEYGITFFHCGIALFIPWHRVKQISNDLKERYESWLTEERFG